MYSVDAPKSGRSGSSAPTGWKSPRSSPRGSNSHNRRRSCRNHSRFVLRLQERVL